MANYGNLVSRTLSVGETGFTGSIHLKLKPSVDAEHNLDTDLADYNSASRIRSKIFSGVTNFKASGLEPIFIPTLDSGFVTNFGKNPNEFAVQNFDALVNGWVIPVRGSKVNGGSYDDLDFVSIELPEAPAPSPMFRQELVLLEVWTALISPNPSILNKPAADRIWKYGNTQYGGSNIVDDLIDPVINAPSSLRKQVQYKIRVVPDVDFANYPDGVNAPNVKARGAANVDTTYTFTRSISDPGLYVAGDGSPSAQSAFSNPEGYVYAIPLFRIHRRNSSAYGLTNPNGSAMSINDPFSDRPDGLFYDEVSLNDIQDLRHLVVSDQSFSEILEDNFDDLLRRDLTLSFGRDAAIDSQIQGKQMLTVDGFSLIDQSGVYDMPFDPDNLRRDYSGENRLHTVVYTIDTSANITSGPVLYNTATRLITILLNGGNIQSAPDVYLSGVVQPTAITGGWIGTYPVPTIQGTLDIGLAGQTLTLAIPVRYNPAGHRFVANSYYRVYNGNPSLNQEWAFVANPSSFTDTRSVLKPSLPVVSGFVDEIFQYPPTTLDSNNATVYPPSASGSNLSNHSYVEQYTKYVLGNSTNTYILPATVDGSNVLGVYAIYVSDITPVAFNQVDPVSVVRNISGTFTVTLPASVSISEIIKFVLVTEKTGVTLDSVSKGIKEIMKTSWYTTTGTGVSSYDIPLDNLPFGVASYIDSTSTLKFYAYVAGTRVDLDNADVSSSLNVLTLTFNSPVANGDEIRVYVLEGYSPVTDDRIQISYNRIPYQGLSSATPLNLARIVAVGQRPVIHSLGSARDTDARNLEMFALSEVLPLGFGFQDTDLQLDNLSLSNSQFTGFKFLRVPTLTHDYRSGSEGKTPEIGDIITLETVGVVPERGVPERRLSLKNRLNLTTYPIEFVTPSLTLARSHQVVTYYLIQMASTKEIYMLVMTYIVNSTGNTVVKADPSQSGVAFDLYRVKGNPILK